MRLAQEHADRFLTGAALIGTVVLLIRAARVSKRFPIDSGRPLQPRADRSLTVAALIETGATLYSRWGNHHPCPVG